MINFLAKFFSHHQARRRSAFRPVAALEARTLLAGNVTAAIVDGELQITGDDEANDIEILSTTEGIIVRGNSTTVNGAATDFVAFASGTPTGPIRVQLGGGNDQLQVDGVTLDQELIVHGGDGDDSLGVTNSTLKQRLVFRGGDGNDSLVADRSTFNRAVIAYQGVGNDLVTMTNSEVKGSLIVYGRQGDDGLNLNATKVNRWLINAMGAGDDDARIANGSDTKHVQLWGGKGKDVALVDNSKISRSFAARMGAGDDSVAFTGTGDVDHRIVVRGGRGTDSFSKGNATLPDNQLIRAENSTVDSTLLNTRLGLGTGGLQNAAAQAKSDFVTSTFVRIATTEGNIDIELNAEDAPVTVANFLNYLSRYSGTIIHHVTETVPDSAESNFVVQGGGFDTALTGITVDTPIPNEFTSTNSNERGTLAMALPGIAGGGSNPDGGTSQWFINVDDNSALDPGKYTVFGKVIGNGMDVVDAIKAITTFNLSVTTSNPSFQTLPLKNYTRFTQNLTGTVAIAANSNSVTGTNTKFNTELTVGQQIQIDGTTFTVTAIASATSMTLSANVTTAVTAGTVKEDATPTDAQLVKITSVSIIDDPA